MPTCYVIVKDTEMEIEIYACAQKRGTSTIVGCTSTHFRTKDCFCLHPSSQYCVPAGIPQRYMQECYTHEKG